MKRLLISIMFALLFVSITLSISFSNLQTYPEQIQIETVDSLEIKQNKLDSIKFELILSVSEYIKNQAPKCHDSIPYYLVEHALNYDIDLCFMMSQTQLETNFGTLGAGRETSKRSLFGVHIYPNTPFKGYPNYNIAIESYCKLLKKSYLVKGRDEHFLMNNYINISGNRYAGSSEYEVHLKYAYRNIRKNTNIEDLQTLYNLEMV
jgi:flagellum-specific peptidoglycan hydrolase FlgJ